jgi:GAF domain-containing protein
MSQAPDDEALAPIDATREAFDWLGAVGDTGLEDWISAASRAVRRIAPDCIAMSVTVLHQDVTFTLASDGLGAALLDAVQYLDGGPCEEAVHEAEGKATRGAQTEESRWQLFAAAEAFAGVASSLSLPLMEGSEVVGGVNLYGATRDAFDGVQEDLAAALGAWAGGAVTNADLDFSTRVRAAAAPKRLQEQSDIDIAAGIVAQTQDIDAAQARARLHHAAARAGVSDVEFAQFIQDAHVNSLS